MARIRKSQNLGSEDFELTMTGSDKYLKKKCNVGIFRLSCNKRKLNALSYLKDVSIDRTL